MAVPSVVRYGYSYLQGAEYAARELGLEPGAVSCKYHYTGTFDILPENQTKAASWYQSGTQCIFAAARPTMFLRRVNRSAATVSRSASIWTSRQVLKRSSLPR